MKNMINYLECLFTKYSESTRLLFLLDRSSLASRRENCCETVGYKELLEEYNKFSGKAKKLSDVLLKNIFDAKGNFICTAWLIEDEKGFFFFLPGTKDMRFARTKKASAFARQNSYFWNWKTVWPARENFSCWSTIPNGNG